MATPQVPPIIERVDIETLRGSSFEDLLFEPPAVGPPRVAPEPRQFDRAPEPVGEEAEITVDDAPERLGFSVRAGLGERVGGLLRRHRPEPVATTADPEPSDPFAAVLSPLSARDLDSLRAEVEAETIIFDSVHKARKAEERSVRGGLILAMAITAAFYGIWRDLFASLGDLEVPFWLAAAFDSRLGDFSDYAEVGFYAITFMCPLIFLMLSVHMSAEFLRAALRLSFLSLINALALATCAVVMLTLVHQLQPVAALVMGLGGYVLGVFLTALSGSRMRRGRGSTRA
ncbi:hypothetical protein [Miltoncostaea oceani]|uniref:hypothetical protein n=1 Tax=Miltoncostaea oceani TaxID=2843216 RepID=UPI001C3D63E5|nr:hypothetical protein [Miltoncostaea oceani]